jgi:hypothetical protein
MFQKLCEVRGCRPSLAGRSDASQLREKYTQLIGQRTQLQSELLKSEEERLQVCVVTCGSRGRLCLTAVRRRCPKR